ncbi:ComF family protein [Amycolatopsis rhizosphaerae]|uniref:ComF family protein n=1 Tax=Amycolatopsis rhizosphaerae TaxID=2053003 RepID=A0A558DMQ4_9PSEU|nr:ComF family protein [Amycolatopsis rhizosphaerae]TVT62307.1 ComF family protein [Amycolatopsis rhizosphaerae]
MGKRVLDLLLPSVCAGCGTPGAACCAQCLAGFSRPEPVTRGPTAGLAPVYALARYRDQARRLVLAYKERGRRDLAPPLGDALAAVLPELPPARPDRHGTWWLVPVPSRRSASRVRGGPHLTRLARACATALAARGHGAAVAPALRLAAGARDAVGLDRARRAANLAGRLRLDPRGLPPRSTPVVLLDDVVTTGVTAAACGRALVTSGFPVVLVLTLTAV